MTDQGNEKAMPSPPATAEEETVARLLEKIKKDSVPMLFGSYESRVVFTDGRLLELADFLPPAIDKMRYLAAGQISSDSVKQTLPPQPDKKAEKVSMESRRGDKYHLSSQTQSCAIDAVYYDYLKMRYPKAEVFCRGPRRPVTFCQDGLLRAVVMPMRE
jgi:hypothetical protein